MCTSIATKQNIINHQNRRFHSRNEDKRPISSWPQSNSDHYTLFICLLYWWSTMGGGKKRFLVSSTPRPQYTSHARLPYIEWKVLITALHRATFCPILSNSSRDILCWLQQPRGRGGGGTLWSLAHSIWPKLAVASQEFYGKLLQNKASGNVINISVHISTNVGTFQLDSFVYTLHYYQTLRFKVVLIR